MHPFEATYNSTDRHVTETSKQDRSQFIFSPLFLCSILGIYIYGGRTTIDLDVKVLPVNYHKAKTDRMSCLQLPVSVRTC